MLRTAALVSLLCASVVLAPRVAAADEAVVVQPKTVTFPSEDGLPVTADLYVFDRSANPAFIVMFHQAGWSRGEYGAIARRLSSGGYNVLAVDQRSGGKVNGVVNATNAAAKKKKLSTRYVDALPDMRAALRYARALFNSKMVIAWGSSYSSALVLHIAGENPKLVDAVLSFAPGEYFSRQGKPKNWIRTSAAKIKVPVFITSAKREHKSWKKIFAAIPGTKKQSFLPQTKGNHGSRALWARFKDSGDYWTAVYKFLGSLEKP